MQLVSNAWAGFGAAFGPLIILSLYWSRMAFAGALSGIIVGALTVLIWIYAPVTVDGQRLSQLMYEIVPGVILSTLAIVGVSLCTKAPAPSIRQLFGKMEQQIKNS